MRLDRRHGGPGADDPPRSERDLRWPALLRHAAGSELPKPESIHAGPIIAAKMDGGTLPANSWKSVAVLTSTAAGLVNGSFIAIDRARKTGQGLTQISFNPFKLAWPS